MTSPWSLANSKSIVIKKSDKGTYDALDRFGYLKQIS